MNNGVTIITDFFKGVGNGIKTAFNTFVYTDSGEVSAYFKNGLEWLLACVALAVVVALLCTLIRRKI